MPAFDFFTGPELVRPDVTADDAGRIAAERFALSGAVHELGSHQDRNFRIDVTTPSGRAQYLLKVDNSAFCDAELQAQDAAMAHLAAAGLRTPVPVPGVDGQTVQRWQRGAGDATGRPALRTRLLTFVDGTPLAERDHLAPSVVAEMGRLAGRVSTALATFAAPSLERGLQWDLRRAQRVVEHLAGSVTDPERRDQVLRVTGEAAARLADVVDRLPIQPLHGDLTDDNLVAARPDGPPDGVIDFGDLALGWRVGELAILVTSLLPRVPDDPLAALAAVRAFDAAVRLTDDEVAALWPLVVLRGAVLAVSGEHQLRIDQGNQYAAARTDAEWAAFRIASRFGWAEAEIAGRIALGRAVAGPVRPESRTAMLAPIGHGHHAVVDLTSTSPALHDGRWLEPDAETRVAQDALRRAPVAVVPYGQSRLTRSPGPTPAKPVNTALFTELLAAPGTTVCSAVTGRVRHAGHDLVRLEGAGFDLVVSGVVPGVRQGATVRHGDPIGAVAAAEVDAQPDHPPVGRLRVQAVLDRPAAPPWFTTADGATAEPVRTFDPAPLIGLPAASAPQSPAAEQRRRGRFLPAASERYYDRPPQFERGWREYLVDTAGRVYVDMVNNVSGIGHAHPRLTEAVHRQMSLLNTNSRFLYRALADFSERLVELSPDPSLDTVLLVNSGTEAVDLALRMAQLHTGHRQVVTLREGYHGWSMAADAVSTSAFDNPGALASRPDWVTVADVPNPYRGTHRGEGCGPAYLADLVAQLDALDAAGRPPAAFISEPVLGNAGGVLLPDGYLPAAYAEVRRRGGVVVADEVQVGYGRLGSHFWGVQQQGVVPDVIAVAKAMGNVYPLGAVITRREIAASLAEEGQFFSSAGGSPVSAVVGLTVLDVMRDEHLQDNARDVGAHLADRLHGLGAKHSLVGAVHGMGLYLGLELVRDRRTLEPAVEETAAVCERLLSRGVVMQPTSERRNVLKIKPPLCLSADNADFFVDALDSVLTEGL